MKGNVVAFDVGASMVRAGKVNHAGKILKAVKRPLAISSKEDAETQIAELAESLADSETLAVGLGLPGQLNVEKGIVLNLPNVLGWKNFPVAALLNKKVGLPVFIENDARCFVVAEFLYGSGKHVNSLVGITLGTGVGGGIILDGRLLHGKNGVAGEVGHLCVEANGPQCSCGGQGCLEELASGKAIESRAQLLLGRKISAEAVAVLAKKKNREALQVMKETGRYLGIAVSGLLNVLNPELVVLGGSVSKSFGLFEEEMRKTISWRALEPARKTPIVVSKLKEPGVLGAAAVAWERMSEK